MLLSTSSFSSSVSLSPLPKPFSTATRRSPSLPLPRRPRSRPLLITAFATATAPAAYKQRMASSTSLYEILRIPVGATCQEIKSAYRRLARTCHPDVAAVDRKDSSADEFIRIHAAYSTLSDPEKRAVYDRKIMRKSRPLSTAAAGFSQGYRGRSWETDQCW